MQILVVDDERFFREVYAQHLGSVDGWTVDVAPDVPAALQRFDQGGVDLVVTDLVMPGADGLALVRALRDRDPDLPVIVVTQREDVRPAVEALRLGVSEYLVKPVDKEMLQVAVQRALDQTGLRRETRRLREERLAHMQVEAVYQACLDLVGILDVDRLQDQLLTTVSSLTGAQGAALWHGGLDGRRPFALRASSGLLEAEALPRELELPADSTLARRLEALSAHIHDGLLYVPVAVDGGLIGAIMLTDKVSGRFGEADLSLGRILGDFAGVALRNALRVAHSQRGGLRDRETAAYNITYFIDYAGKEIYKARRYGRTFSLVTLQVDNLAVIKRAVSGEATRSVHRALIEAVQRVIRDSDILAKVTDDTFYLLLPETDYFGALMFVRRTLAGFAGSARIAALSVPPAVSVGAASYPKDGEDFDELLMQCRRRQEEARKSPFRRLHLEEHGFWGLVDALAAASENLLGPTGGRRASPGEGFAAALLSQAGRDLARDPSARGLLYHGARVVGGELPLVRALDGVREAASRVYLLGRRLGEPVEHPAVTVVPLPDEGRLERSRFLLLLTEHAAYAWIEGEDGQSFHTSDPPLVEALVARLQEAYDLQRQY